MARKKYTKNLSDDFFSTIIPPKKVCSACKELKDKSEFCKNFELHDNLKAQCKKCMYARRKKKEKNIIPSFIF